MNNSLIGRIPEGPEMQEITPRRRKSSAAGCGELTGLDLSAVEARLLAQINPEPNNFPVPQRGRRSPEERLAQYVYMYSTSGE